MGALGGLIGGSGKAREYRQKARLARAQGELEKSNYYRQATATEEEAKANAGVERYNMVQVARAGSEAEGDAAVARAGSGFDVGSGTGGAVERGVRENVMGQLANAAMSSSISQANALNSAVSSRRQGDAARAAAEAEARQYEAAAKSVKKGSWFSGALSLLGGIGGLAIGGLPGAVKGLDLGWDLGASVNPFLAEYGDGEAVTRNAMGLYNMWRDS